MDRMAENMTSMLLDDEKSIMDSIVVPNKSDVISKVQTGMLAAFFSYEPKPTEHFFTDTSSAVPALVEADRISKRIHGIHNRFEKLDAVINPAPPSAGEAEAEVRPAAPNLHQPPSEPP